LKLEQTTRTKIVSKIDSGIRKHDLYNCYCLSFESSRRDGENNRFMVITGVFLTYFFVCCLVLQQAQVVKDQNRRKKIV
jgi:hypothetical protein